MKNMPDGKLTLAVRHCVFLNTGSRTVKTDQDYERKPAWRSSVSVA